MHQLRQLFERITLPQRIWLAAAAVAVIGGITMLTRWTEERDFKPLFTGLAAEDAGSLVAKLRESLDEGYREAVEAARQADPPTTVRAYSVVYGHFPAGWPPEA